MHWTGGDGGDSSGVTLIESDFAYYNIVTIYYYFATTTISRNTSCMQVEQHTFLHTN